jgi:beta-1,4-mannosyl-glycoprotein beta-1,4-N-acetylglucosaminyltransferase
MRIFDCFIFNHEIELLEIRLNILNDYVDKFIITEGDVTFSGLPKESHFLNNKERFAKWEDKIILNQINIPECESPWHREIYSRNAMVNLDIFNDDDLIIMSDGDEIPNPEILEQASEWVSDDTHFTFEQSCYAYWMNNLYSDKWFGTRAATYKYVNNTTVDDIREGTEDESKITGSIITNGGWHFTYLGDESHIRQKINSFCDRHFDVPEVTENISKNLEGGTDVLNRTHITYSTVDLDDSFPQYIIDNQEKYSHLIK